MQRVQKKAPDIKFQKSFYMILSTGCSEFDAIDVFSLSSKSKHKNWFVPLLTG